MLYHSPCPGPHSIGHSLTTMPSTPTINQLPTPVGVIKSTVAQTRARPLNLEPLDGIRCEQICGPGKYMFTSGPTVLPPNPSRDRSSPHTSPQTIPNTMRPSMPWDQCGSTTWIFRIPWLQDAKFKIVCHIHFSRSIYIQGNIMTSWKFFQLHN